MFKLYIEELDNEGTPWCSVFIENSCKYRKCIYTGIYDGKVIKTIEDSVKYTYELFMQQSAEITLNEYQAIVQGKKSGVEVII